MAGTILVIDDDPDFVELIRALLRDRYVVEGCTDSRTALLRINQVNPMMVFIDLYMPPPSGWDLLRGLRSDPRFADLPILVVSAVGVGVDAADQSLPRDGPIDILTKPFEIDELLDRVTLLVQRRPRHSLAGRVSEDSSSRVRTAS